MGQRQRVRRLALVGAAVAAAWRAEGVVLELPLEQKGALGPLAARLEVGTPPQRLWLRVDTASQWTYVLDERSVGEGGFSSENSSTAKIGKEKTLQFLDGYGVRGDVLRETVKIGSTTATEVPLLLARNFSSPAPHHRLGLLGLVSSGSSGGEAAGWNPFSSESLHPQGLLQRGLFEYLWEQNPEVPRTFRLELGGPTPRLLVGARAEEKPREMGGVRYLSAYFTSRSSQWFVSVRAIGLSKGKNSPFLHWNLDFNALVPYGAPALLDSNSPALRVGSVVYSRLVAALPDDCRSTVTAATKYKVTSCPCQANRIETDFPSISISFEAAETFRFLGLDSGADVIACIPPQAYVSYDEGLKRCIVAIVDGGPNHMKFHYEFVVLGLPFFRSAAVVLDADHRRVGIGPPLAVSPPPPAGAAGTAGGDHTKVGEDGPQQPAAPAPGPPEWDPSSIEQLGTQEKCQCADPKNWWSTGKRLSPRRVAVVLVGVTLLAAYIFVAHSPSPAAEGLRDLAENLCGNGSGGSAAAQSQVLPGGPPGVSASSAAAAAAERRFGESNPDRPLIQMANRGDA